MVFFLLLGLVLKKIHFVLGLFFKEILNAVYFLTFMTLHAWCLVFFII